MWILFINVQWNCVASHIKISTLSIGNVMSVKYDVVVVIHCQILIIVEINREANQNLKLTKFDLVLASFGSLYF
jgi:hypothetical protein